MVHLVFTHCSYAVRLIFINLHASEGKEHPAKDSIRLASFGMSPLQAANSGTPERFFPKRLYRLPNTVCRQPARILLASHSQALAKMDFLTTAKKLGLQRWGHLRFLSGSSWGQIHRSGLKERHFKTFLLARAVLSCVGYYLCFNLISLPDVWNCSDTTAWGWESVLDISRCFRGQKSNEAQTREKKEPFT